MATIAKIANRGNKKQGAIIVELFGESAENPPARHLGNLLREQLPGAIIRIRDQSTRPLVEDKELLPEGLSRLEIERLVLTELLDSDRVEIALNIKRQALDGAGPAEIVQEVCHVL
jgi:hypothetical protein